MKSVYYVAAVVAAYRKAIDAYYEERENYKVRPEWREELEKVSHRPYTTAFAFQNPDKTEQGELVSSYQCSPLTVDEEFLLTKRLSFSII